MNYMKSNKNGVKLLAAVAVLALAVCSFAVIGFEQVDGADVKSIDNGDGFTKALVNGGEYKVSGNISVALSDKIEVKNNTVIDLNGKTITITGGKNIAILGTESTSISFTVKNGSIVWTGFEKGNIGAFVPQTNAKFTLDSVDLTTDGSAVFPNGDAAEVTIKDSTILAGTYAVGTNASLKFQNYGMTITITGSTLSARGFDPKNSFEDKIDCTVLINVPYATLNIGNSTINGDMQAMFIRNGTATVTDTTINYTAAYGNGTGNWDNTTWESGNKAPVAAVVVGDNSNGYEGKAVLNMSGCKILVGSDKKAVFVSDDSNTKAFLNITSGTMAVSNGAKVVDNGTISLGDGVLIYNNGLINGSGKFTFADDAAILAPAKGKTSLNEFNGAFARISEKVGDITYTHAYGGLAYMASKVTEWEKGTDTVGKQIFIFGDYSLTTSVTIPSGVALKIQDSLEKQDTVINMSGSGSITLAAGSSVQGTISNTVENGKSNSITFPVGTTSNGITISVGSIKVNGSLVAPANGVIAIDGDAVVDGDTTFEDATITLAAGSSLTVPAGTTLNVKGIEPSADNTGADCTIVVGNGAVIDAVIDEDLKESIDYDAEDGQFAFGDTLNSDHDVTVDEYLSKDLIIPAGVKLTVTSNGVLNLAGHSIILFGELEIQTGGTIASIGSGTEAIFLIKDCVFTNDGILGIGSSAVTISAETEGESGAKTIFSAVESQIKYTAEGSVSMIQANGAEFSIVKSGKADGSYVLAVSGDIYTNASSGEFTINKTIVNDALTIGDNVNATVSGSVTVTSGATLTVDGYMSPAASGNKVVLENKSTFIANGSVDSLVVEAQTGYFETAQKYSSLTLKNTTIFTFPDSKLSLDANGAVNKTNGIAGLTITVGTFSSTRDNDDGTKTAMTTQVAYVSGDLSFVNVTINADGTQAAPGSGTTDGTVAITGNAAYVAKDDTLSLKSGMKITNGEAIVVQGTVVYADSNSVDKYKGTNYSVKTTTTPAVITYYIKPFDVAIVEIDNVDKKTLNVNDSKVIIKSDLTLTEGQILNIDAAVDFIVNVDGKLTVNAKARITGTIDTVKGVLKIMNGGSCSAPTNYASYVKATDSVQYSGIVVALSNANPGDVITINSPATISEGDLVIKEGVTVNASKDITVKDGNVEIYGKLVLKDSAKLDVQGEKRTVKADGTLDAADGNVAVATDGKVFSEGTTILAPATATETFLKNKVNGFAYVNDDGDVVITSAQGAVDALAALDDDTKNVTVYGNVAVSELNLKTDMIVDDKAKVNLGNVTIADDKSIALNGKTTGKFSAQTGVVESTTGALTTSTIEVVEAWGITIGAGSITDSMNVTTDILYIFGTLKGEATVVEGTATIGYGSTNKTLTVNMSGNDRAVFTVSAGTFVNVDSGMTLAAGVNTTSTTTTTAVIVKGTLSITKNGTLSAPAAINNMISISGTLIIGDEATVDYNGAIFLSGKITVSETESKEGSLVVKQYVSMAENASITGPVTLDTKKYIQAMDGADLTGAKINVNAAGVSSAFSTTFFINGDAYATVYTIDAVMISDIFKTLSFKVDGLELDGAKVVTNWCQSDDYTRNLVDGATVDKDISALYFKAEKSRVTGTVSTGVGLQIYLNGVSVDNYFVGGATGYSIPVGTYKVTIEAQNGYDKSTATISFNGATVADGGSITFIDDGFTLTANGATAINGSTSGSSSSSDDGMSITDILLIVLVVLIVIMAVLVAIRMMRS